MNILLVFQNPCRSRHACVAALARRPGVNVKVLCTAACARQLRTQFNGEIDEIKIDSKLQFSTVAKIRHEFKCGCWDVIHPLCRKALPNVVAASYGLRLRPKIVAFRGIQGTLSRFNPAHRTTFLNPAVEGICCESNAVRQALVASGIQPNKLLTTYNCSPFGDYECLGKPGLEALGIPRGSFIVGTVANVRRVKGIDVLLEAVQNLDDISDLHLVVIGEIRDQRIAKLAQRDRQRGRIHLVGYQPNAISLVGGMDLFVMPSRSEGLSRALIEAMSQRVCPVASNVGGMPELVRDQIDGLIFPSEDTASLAVAIRRLYVSPDLRERFAKSAQRRIRQDFSPEAMADRFLQLYQRVHSN